MDISPLKVDAKALMITGKGQAPWPRASGPEGILEIPIGLHPISCGHYKAQARGKRPLAQTLILVVLGDRDEGEGIRPNHSGMFP
jgi:hypothetical protein